MSQDNIELRGENAVDPCEGMGALLWMFLSVLIGVATVVGFLIRSA